MRPALVKTSKLLSLILRHNPGRIGLTLDGAGWADLRELVERAQHHGIRLDVQTVLEVVEHNDKKRFTLSGDGRRIRAAQGHSIPVDLGLPEVEPPELLFHGTAARNLESIRARGLHPGRRQHVHLSPDAQTAVRVGQRHGEPAVLRIQAGAMRRAGHAFHFSENGVWLTASVPPEFIEAAAAE
ncbi:MAG: RNA 2'-phosphotransferase [Thermoanaerobaculaceae bacterium]